MVRSRKFFNPTALTVAPLVLYTVPADRTAIVKSLWLVNTTTTQRVFNLCINAHIQSQALYWQNTLGALGTYLVPLAFVLNPGDQLIGSCTTANTMNVAAFGALLNGVPG